MLPRALLPAGRAKARFYKEARASRARSTSATVL